MSAAGPGRPAPRPALPARPLQIKPQEPGHNGGQRTNPAQLSRDNVTMGELLKRSFIILLVTNGVGVWQGPPDMSNMTNV